MTIEAWLLAHIEYDTNGGCWLWSGGLFRSGYGQVRYEGRTQRAHRVAFRLWRGPIPEDRPDICHRCDTPACIRPDHLFADTHDENMRDKAVKGRTRAAVLQPEDIPVIRARLAAGETQKTVAADYGVSRTAIGKLARGQRWAHVET